MLQKLMLLLSFSNTVTRNAKHTWNLQNFNCRLLSKELEPCIMLSWPKYLYLPSAYVVGLRTFLSRLCIPCLLILIWYCFTEDILSPFFVVNRKITKYLFSETFLMTLEKVICSADEAKYRSKGKLTFYHVRFCSILRM